MNTTKRLFTERAPAPRRVCLWQTHSPAGTVPFRVSHVAHAGTLPRTLWVLPRATSACPRPPALLPLRRGCPLTHLFIPSFISSPTLIHTFTHSYIHTFIPSHTHSSHSTSSTALDTLPASVFPPNVPPTAAHALAPHALSTCTCRPRAVQRNWMGGTRYRLSPFHHAAAGSPHSTATLPHRASPHR